MSGEDPGTIAGRLPAERAPAEVPQTIDVGKAVLEGGPGAREVASFDPTFAEYRKRTTIYARKMTEPFHVETLEGRVTGKAGDWLAIGIEGEMYPIAASVFETSYEGVPPATYTEVERLSDVQAIAEDLELVYVPEQHRLHAHPQEECNIDSSHTRQTITEAKLARVSPDVKLCEHCVSPEEARIIRAGLRR